MKLNIEIDLNDFYCENFESDEYGGAQADGSISKEIVDIIKSEVKSAIAAKVRGDVRDIAENAYAYFAEKKMEAIVNSQMDQFIQTGTVRKNHHDSELVPVSEKLRSVFDCSNNWNSPTKQMEELGKKFGAECRKRYDMSFASSIVTGLEKQGLLKPGVFEAITNGS